MMHVVLSIVFESQLLFPPITRPRRILECGFGAGDWAIDVARQYQTCEVCIAQHSIFKSCCILLTFDVRLFSKRPNDWGETAMVCWPSKIWHERPFILVRWRHVTSYSHPADAEKANPLQVKGKRPAPWCCAFCATLNCLGRWWPSTFARTSGPMKLKHRRT